MNRFKVFTRGGLSLLLQIILEHIFHHSDLTFWCHNVINTYKTGRCKIGNFSFNWHTVLLINAGPNLLHKPQPKNMATYLVFLSTLTWWTKSTYYILWHNMRLNKRT